MPTFHVVSDRAPRSVRPDAWRIETKPYQPALQEGDRLSFTLRANPTKRENRGKGPDRRRHDVVMAAKRRLREAGQSFEEDELARAAGLAWLNRQGELHGFAVRSEDVLVHSHRQHRFRKANDPKATLCIAGLDFDGVLQVTDPARFRDALFQGIGPAKGFGFGLLLVKRA